MQVPFAVAGSGAAHVEGRARWAVDVVGVFKPGGCELACWDWGPAGTDGGVCEWVWAGWLIRVVI